MGQRAARNLGRVHLAMVAVWSGLAFPTAIWWKDSVLWVALLSLYANAASHWAAWQASRAEQNTN